MTNYQKSRINKIGRYMDGIVNDFRKFPVSLQVSLTDSCKNRCFMCHHWEMEAKHEIFLESLVGFLEYGIKNGLETVCYSGGDPFCYSHINKIMEWHVANKVKFGIITAGATGIADIGLIRHAEFVRVSLDAIDPVLYSKLRGGIAVDDVMESVVTLCKGGNVGLNITLSRYNAGEICKIVEFAILNGIKEMNIWPVRHMKSAEVDIVGLNLDSSRLSENGIKHNFDTAVDIILKGELEIFSYCKAVLLQAFINSDGSIHPCCILAGDTEKTPQWDRDFGNISDADFSGFHSKSVEFSKIMCRELPFGCSGCTKRFNTINAYCDSNWNSANFI